MKLIKTASGKKQIKISKSEWQSIGKKAGWMKELFVNKLKVAEEIFDIPEIQSQPQSNQLVSNIDPDQELYKSLNNLRVITSKNFEDTEKEYSVERSTSSSWGGREVYEGNSIRRSYSAILTGDINLTSDIINSSDIEKSLEEYLTEMIKIYGREGAIESIQDNIDNLYNNDEDNEIETVDVNIKVLTHKKDNIYTVTFALDYETIGFLSDSELRSRAAEERGEAEFERRREENW
jgi:hypothetical protein